MAPPGWYWDPLYGYQHSHQETFFLDGVETPLMYDLPIFDESPCQHPWDHRWANRSTGPVPLDYESYCLKCPLVYSGRENRYIFPFPK
jgi:hypothetical protein